MTQLLQVRNHGLIAGTRIYPGICGRGDTAPLIGNTCHPLLNFQKVTVNPNPQMATVAQEPPFGRQLQLYFEDVVGGSYNRLVYNVTTPPSPKTSGTMSVWSARLTYRMSALGDLFVANTAPFVARFSDSMAGGAVRFDIRLNAYSIGELVPLQPYIPGVTGVAANGLGDLATYHVEIQADQSRNPRVVVRFYKLAQTTVWAELRGNPTSVAIDQVELGDLGSNYTNPYWIGDLEIHDDYNLGGAMTSNPASPTAATAGAARSTPYTAPSYRWSEWNGTTEQSVTLAGKHTGGGAVAADANWSEVTRREIVPPSYTTTTHTFRTSPNLSLDLYRPATGGPFATVLYLHSGFGTAGTRTSDLPLGFVQQMIQRGVAVGSADYNLGTAMIGAPLQPSTYPVWPASGSAQYPSHIIDAKAAARYLIQNAGTLNLSGVVALVGYSFGGYLAHAVNVSRDLTDDGSGRNLTLNHPTYGIGSGLSDPVVAGSYSLGGPISFQTAYDYDPTDPSKQPSGAGYGPLNQGVGTLRAACKAFRGLAYNAVPNLTNTDLPAMMGRPGQAARCAPIGALKGASDYLVHWAHEPLLAAAAATAGVPYSSYTSPTVHDNLMAEWNPVHLSTFLTSVGV